MAKIISDDQQTKALEKINEIIKDAETLNKFLQQKEFTLYFLNGKKPVIYGLDKECSGKIVAMLKKVKAKNLKEAEKLAAKHRIQLTDEDLDVLTFGLDDSEEDIETETDREAFGEESEGADSEPEVKENDPAAENKVSGDYWN